MIGDFIFNSIIWLLLKFKLADIVFCTLCEGKTVKAYARKNRLYT